MKLKNLEILEITAAYLNLKASDKSSLSLPFNVSWKRRLNFDKLTKVRDLILEAVKELDTVYFDEEHSEVYLDASGKEIKDADGNPVRVVKPAYREEYKTKREEVLSEETEVEIKKVKISEIPEDLKLTDADMDTLQFMIEEETDG